MRRLEGRRALITGAGGGIGSACADRLLAEGASVHLVDLDPAALARSMAELAGRHGAHRVWTHRIDVTRDDDWATLATGFEREFGALHVLVNAAGISGLRDIEAADFPWWRRFQSINADSIFLSIHHLLPALKASDNAAIVNIGSTLALKPSAQLPAYSASKGSLRNLTKSVALHCANAGYRIRCNAVHPGSTLTPMMEANLGASEQERQDNMAWRMSVHPYSNAIGRIATPADIAAAVAFLVSDDAAFVTGIDLPVDGGATI